MNIEDKIDTLIQETRKRIRENITHFITTTHCSFNHHELDEVLFNIDRGIDTTIIGCGVGIRLTITGSFGDPLIFDFNKPESGFDITLPNKTVMRDEKLDELLG